MSITLEAPLTAEPQTGSAIAICEDCGWWEFGCDLAEAAELVDEHRRGDCECVYADLA